MADDQGLKLRFNTGDLLIAIAFIALGLGIWLTKSDFEYKLVCFPMFGAGLLKPFGRPGLGAFYGCLVAAALVAFMILLALSGALPVD